MSTLATILDLTDQVQAAINDGDWQHAHALDNERRGRLEELLARERGAAVQPGALREALMALQQRNQHMVGEVHHHRRRILREASMLKTGHAAAERYSDIPMEP